MNEEMTSDKEVIPTSFIKMNKEFDIHIENAADEEKMTIFADIFSMVLLSDTPYANKLPFNFPKKLISRFVSYFNETCNPTIINDDSFCPCGSGDIYKLCCKGKRFKWSLDKENNLVKSIPISGDFIEELSEYSKRFEEIFGRSQQNDERLIFDSMSDGREFFSILRQIRHYELAEEEKLYATYKTGRFITDENQDLLTERDLEEWKEALMEYRKLMNEVRGNEVSIVQLVSYTNDYLKMIYQRYIPQAVSVINYYISNESEFTISYKDMKIKDIKSFIMYCLYKLRQNLSSIEILIEQGNTENAFAITRFVYELHVNLKVYMNDFELFKEKIIPKAGIGNGTHIKIKKNLVKDIENNEEFNIRITEFELNKKLGENYERFYDLLYRSYSDFVHVGLSSVEKYFKIPDLFLEVDEGYIAGLISLFFTHQTIVDICETDHIGEQIKKDLIYFTEVLSENLKKGVCLLRNIEPDAKLYSEMNEFL